MKTGRNKFDEHIKDALESLENVPQQADWGDFMEQLEAAEIADASAMDDDAMFDSLVMAGLGGLEVDFDPSSWDALEEKMTSEALMEDAEFDELARQALHNYEAPYQKSHWEIMAERLEEEFSLRRKLYRYKVLELALMLLFIFTLINYLPFGGNKFEKLKAFNFEIFKSNSPSTTPNIKKEKVEKAKTTSENKEASLLKVAPIAENLDLEKEDNTKNDVFVPINNWTNTVTKSKEQQTIPATLPKMKQVITSNHSDNVYVGVDNSEIKNGSSSITTDTEQQIQSVLDALDLPKAELLDFNRVAPSMILVPNKEKMLMRFSMVGNFEANYIFSPVNEELGSSQDTTLGWGYGGGILGGFKLGKWGFETGGIYNHKSYPPNFVNQFNPNNDKNLLESEYFQDIQLEILQIPVNAQYFIVNKPKWRVYASTGVSINLLLSPVYQISETRAALVTAAPLAPPDSEPDNSLKNKAEFPTGILNGGNLKENSYLTTQFGLGIERSVGNRWSVFAQPNYQHYLSKNGLKPFNDKFYTLSLSVGTRVSIK